MSKILSEILTNTTDDAFDNGSTLGDPNSWRTGEEELGLDHVLSFGKHEGQTLEYVIKNYPSYILWMQETFPDMVLSEDADELLVTIVERHDSDYYFSSW